MANSKRLEAIKSLLVRQKFAVVSTHCDGQPYCNLVAFAETEDIRNLIFVTSRNTSKYQNLMKDSRVSFLIDNRTNLLADFRSATAVTAIGKARELNSDNLELYRAIFLRKHPNLVDFVDNDKSSLFLVRVNTYVMAGFEEVERVDF
jgi:nitroimidazol reductase NimA-like FMN-containing flavoprotein (pyridoxamine 5'-phosphate oxidase superfamily)